MTARVLWLKMCFKKGHQSSRTRKNLRIAALANSSKAGEGKKQRLQIVDIKRPMLEWIKVFIRTLSVKEQGRLRTKIKKSCSQRKRYRHFEKTKNTGREQSGKMTGSLVSTAKAELVAKGL